MVTWHQLAIIAASIIGIVVVVGLVVAVLTLVGSAWGE
jgi:hypothetical protein